MANDSVVCTDKIGILTQNVMTVVAGSVGRREVRASVGKEYNEVEHR
jgi:magnesium-transporting ATPase (P-type)